MAGIENFRLGKQTCFYSYGNEEEIEKLFANPEFYKTHGREAKQLQTELKEVIEKLEFSYSRWEELEAVSKLTP